MDIRHLTYFVEVCKEKSFTYASKNLHISQPALSKMIKNLEAELNLTLIDRSEKKFTLTDVGKKFFEESEKMIENFEDVLESVYDTVNLKRGRVKIGLPPVIGTAYFPQIIAGFREKYPGVELDIIEQGAKAVKTKVAEGSIDIGVVIEPINKMDFDIIPIVQDKVVVIVNKDNPLSEKQTISIEELKDETFVILNENFMIHNYIISECREANFEPKIAFKSSQWDFLAEMVSLNQGISILPKPILKRFKSNNIKQIPIKGSFSEWRIALILKKNRYMSYAVKEFVKYIEEHFKN